MSILKTLSAGLNQALGMIESSPLENFLSPEPNLEDPKQKKLLLNIMPAEEERALYSEYEIEASMMIRKVAITPIYKLKHAMFKKMLLRLITAFYEERTKELNIKAEFGVYVFTSLMKKYMMKKAAQNRFKHLLSSCMKYKSIGRVRVFGRFIGLYDVFDNNDLNLYLTSLTTLKSSLVGRAYQNPDFAERHYTSYNRCIECIKLLSKNLPLSEIEELTQKIGNMRHTEPHYKALVVDVDEFLELLLEKYHVHKNESYAFLKYIYEAADLNEDGYLQYQEFELLMRHLTTVPMLEIRNLFTKFAETFLSEDDLEVKAISLENLYEMNSQKNVFSPEKVKELTGTISAEEAEDMLKRSHENLEVRLNEIQWRLSESKELGQYQEEFSALIETLRIKVYACTNPNSVWLCLRLLEAESIRSLVHDRLIDMLPSFSSGFVSL